MRNLFHLILRYGAVWREFFYQDEYDNSIVNCYWINIEWSVTRIIPAWSKQRRQTFSKRTKLQRSLKFTKFLLPDDFLSMSGIRIRLPFVENTMGSSDRDERFTPGRISGWTRSSLWQRAPETLHRKSLKLATIDLDERTASHAI